MQASGESQSHQKNQSPVHVCQAGVCREANDERFARVPAASWQALQATECLYLTDNVRRMRTLTPPIYLKMAEGSTVTIWPT